MASAFGQPGQQQQSQPYMGAQLPDYSQQARYGGMQHAAGYGVLPYAAVPPAAQYLPQAGMPGSGDGPYDADALALGMNNMVLGPGQQQMMQLGPGQYYPQQPRMPAGPGYPPSGYGYPPQAPVNAPMRGPPMPQQQYQQHQQHQQAPGQQGMGPPMGMNGHHPMEYRGPPVQNGRGGPGPRMGPGPGRGMGPQQQQQQMQRGGRKKVQRGLEDNVRRTVYISYIDQQVCGWKDVRLAAAAIFLAAP